MSSFSERSKNLGRYCSAGLSEEMANEIAVSAIHDAVGAVIVVDEHAIVHLFNPQAERLFGYSAAEVLGLSMSSLIDLDLSDIRKSAPEANGARRETSGKRKDGSTFFLELSLTGFSLREQKFYCGLLHDISDLKKIEMELIEARYSAEANAEAKSRFLAQMSHEIRTPLSSILGFTEMLQNDQINTEEAARVLQIISRNGQHLLGVINDILDISKVESGKIEIEKLECSPFAILSELEALMDLRARENQLFFQTDCVFPLPLCVVTDPGRLKQVLVNLAGNAIKFTQRGGVRLIASYDPGPNHLIFRVIDTGIGMTTGQMAKLFKPFAQASQSTTREFGGSGLGLAISKELAWRLGGDITVHSSPNAGSTFTLSIDAGKPARDSLVNEAPAPLADDRNRRFQIPLLKGKVLVAEDGQDNQQLIHFLLGKCGAESVPAANGREAFNLASACDFDLILMDMQMPVMDGYTATSLLRQQGYRKPIVALTASALKHDIERALKAGCISHLSKPFQQKDFFRTIATYLHKASDDEPADREQMLADPEMRRAVMKFVEGLPSRLRGCKEAFDASNWEELRNLAHKLRGAELFGFPEITQIAADLEKNSLHGRQSSIAAGIQALEESCARTISAFEQ